MEVYLVKWKGHAGKTWESLKAIKNTHAWHKWQETRKMPEENETRDQRGRYMICCGTLDSRYCCKHCKDHSTWNERIFIDAEFNGNVRRLHDLSTRG